MVVMIIVVVGNIRRFQRYIMKAKGVGCVVHSMVVERTFIIREAEAEKKLV